MECDTVALQADATQEKCLNNSENKVKRPVAFHKDKVGGAGQKRSLLLAVVVSFLVCGIRTEYRIRGFS